MMILLAGCVSIPPPGEGDLDQVDDPVDDKIGGNELRDDFEQPYVENGSIGVLFDKNASYDITILASVRARPENLLYGMNTSPLTNVGSQASRLLHSYDTFTTPRIDVFAQGKAAVQLGVRWDIANAAGALGADTLYTVYPDGRIHKSIRFMPDLATNPTEISTYLSAHRPFFDKYLTHVDASPFLFETDFEMSVLDTHLRQSDDTNNRLGFGCFTADEGALLGMGYLIPETAQDGYLIFTEETGTLASDHRATLEYGWAYDVENSDEVGGEFLLYGGVSGPTGEECADFLRHLEAFQQPPQLTPAPGQESILVTTEIGDIDDDGYNEESGNYVLSAVDTKTLRFQLIGAKRPPTTAFKIYGLASDKAPTIVLDDRELVNGTDFLYQSAPLGDDFEGWLYLHREFPSAADIVITFQ